MKDSLLRHIKAAAPAKADRPRTDAQKILAVDSDPSQPATKAQPWWAPDAVAAAPKPAPAAQKPAPAKMNATVVDELARIASQPKR